MSERSRPLPPVREMPPEPWLRGPVEGVPPLLQPVAHALVHAVEDVRRVVTPLSAEMAWKRPGGAASIGLHVRHAGASLDRLFTYARGESLSAQQHDVLKSEGVAGERPEDGAALAAGFESRVELALAQLRATPEATLLEPRAVGRQHLPSTVLGLLFHAAEHTQRHVGQVITTARVIGA